MTPENRFTERDVLDLLLARYGVRYGNGERYAVAEHVRSGAGFDAKRTADFVAMDLWPSKGLCLHGHEVKVSRSDWLVELKQPEKSAEFIPFMDYWWLVVSDKEIVHDGELPAGWGLLAPRGDQLVVVRSARRVPAQPLSRTRMAALVRAVAKTARRAGLSDQPPMEAR
jgi:hypothetical protein